MPVVLTPEDYATWLDPDGPVEAALELLAPSPNNLLEAVPLDRAVNSNRADGPELLKRAGPTESWSAT
jgi:putative SOS response-associated peptidase YedK